MSISMILGAAVVLVLVVVVIATQVFGSRDEASPPPRAVPGGSGDAEVDRLLAEGNKIAAIIRVRLLTSWGLKEAKDYVDALPNAPPLPKAPTQATLDVDDAEVRSLVAQGRNIDAIKRVRELTGCGLREAKDYVDRLAGGPA